MTLILASKSASRRKLLMAVGLDIKIVPSKVDEGKIKKKMLREGAKDEEIAQILAIEKAKTVSSKHPDNYVIGADQILVCEGELFDKARDLNEAENHLKFFRGKPHTLVTSVVIVKNKDLVWSHISKPVLYMREFSDQFLTNYIKTGEDALLNSVGCYFIEECGAQLFSKIDGDYYSILGMPLIPLLTKLRELKLLDE